MLAGRRPPALVRPRTPAPRPIPDTIIVPARPGRDPFVALLLILVGVAMATCAGTVGLLVLASPTVLPLDESLRTGYSLGLAIAVGLGAMLVLAGVALRRQHPSGPALAAFAGGLGALISFAAAVAFASGDLLPRLGDRAAVQAVAGFASALLLAILLGGAARSALRLRTSPTKNRL